MTSVMVYFDARGLVPMLGANAVVIVLMFVLNPLLPKHQPNRRIPLYGSRFNPMPGERVFTRPTDPTALEDRPVEGMVAGAAASNR
jgi:hypothetical protein